MRLITRHGNDFTARFPLAAAAVVALPAHSFLIDGEAIVTNANGLAVFDLIRHKRHGGDAVLIAFDLIELDGVDLRRLPIEYRKHKLAKLVRIPHPGIVLNEHYEGDGDIVFEHACKLGCEGRYLAGSKRMSATMCVEKESEAPPESPRRPTFGIQPIPTYSPRFPLLALN